MAQTASRLTKTNRRIVNEYLRRLAMEIKLDGALLFGSYAYGKPTRHSDVDLIILSSDFNRLNFTKRLIFLSRMRRGVAEDIAMDVIGYTPKEFMTIERESAIASRAKKSGVWLTKN